MSEYTVLGFDFGLKHIGVAVGQTVTGTANPLASLSAYQGEPEWEQITDLITYWQPKALMVGIPLSIDGNEEKITRAARRFAKHLEERYHLAVHKIDERFTTLEAKQNLFDKGGLRALSKRNIDGWSAKIITESGLEQCRNLL